MHATIDAQFTVNLDIEEIVRSLNEALVEAYCGEKMRAETATAVSSALEPRYEQL